MEREAREVQEKQYASNSKKEVCLSNATEEIDNRDNKEGMRNRMQSKQQPPHMDRLGGGAGVPPRGPHQDRTAEALGFRELLVAPGCFRELPFALVGSRGLPWARVGSRGPPPRIGERNAYKHV